MNWGVSCEIVSRSKSRDVFNRAVTQNLIARQDNSGLLQFARKDSQSDLEIAVPQTDTGGLVEKTKVSERKMFKELGKQTTRNFGRWVASSNIGCN